MAVEKIRSQLISSIWQAVAQSGVDLSAVPQDQQEKLIGKIADNVMVTMDSILEEEASSKQAEEKQDEQDERILWQGRPFLSMVENYTITSERIKITTGLLGRNVENFELIRIQDIDYNQAVTDRMVGVGDISIRGQDPSEPKIVLRNVHHPEDVYNVLRKAWMDARKRYGLQFREYM